MTVSSKWQAWGASAMVPCDFCDRSWESLIEGVFACAEHTASAREIVTARPIVEES